MRDVMIREFGRYLHDRRRTECFRRAIEAQIRPGDVVVDLGTGFGLLAMFCAQRGARVYAIEQGPYLNLAAAIAADNGLAELITWVQGNSAAVQLPEQVNVIVSETVGQFGLEEFTVEYIRDARVRFGKPECIVIPRRLKLYVAPVSVVSIRKDLALRFGTVGRTETGLELRRLQQAVLVNELDPYVAVAPADCVLLGEPARLGDFALGVDGSSNLDVSVSVACERDGECDGWLGMFQLDLSEGTTLNVGPGSPETHWRSTLFPFYPSRAAVRGQRFSARFMFSRGTWRFSDR